MKGVHVGKKSTVGHSKKINWCVKRKSKQLIMRFSTLAGQAQKDIEESISGPHYERDDDESASAFSGHVVLAVFSMIWSTVVMELWKRRSSSLSYRWGTLRLTERYAEPRPGFHGELGVNPVTGRVEPIFPEWQRDLRIALVSLPVVLLFLGIAFPTIQYTHNSKYIRLSIYKMLIIYI